MVDSYDEWRDAVVAGKDEGPDVLAALGLEGEFDPWKDAPRRTPRYPKPAPKALGPGSVAAAVAHYEGGDAEAEAEDVPFEVTAHAKAGDKFTDDEVSPQLARAAAGWLGAYTGDFEYLTSLREQNATRGLSRGQVRGVLNCWVADIKRQQRQATPAAPTAQHGAFATAIRDGLYTVAFTEGTFGGQHRTIRIRTGREDAANMQFVSYLSGSDNESDYTCCGFVRDGAYRWTRAFSGQAGSGSILEAAVRYLLEGTEEARTAAGRAYAQESGNCYVCNRTLTDPVSIELGIGPICRDK